MLRASPQRLVCHAAAQQLSPRQRRLAAKKKQKKEQPTAPTQAPKQGSFTKQPILQQQQQQQQQQQHQALPNSPQTESGTHALSRSTAVQDAAQQQQEQQLPASITSLQTLIRQQQQQQKQGASTPTQSSHHTGTAAELLNALASLQPVQLSQLIKNWAQHGRSMTYQDLEDAGPLLHCYVTTALLQLQQGQLNRQQLADVAWGLAHFDALEWRCLQLQQHMPQQQQQQQCQQQQSQQQQTQQQQQQPCCRLPLRWSGPFQAALDVPFLVLPNLMLQLRLEEFEAEVTLQRDVIYLTDAETGAVRAVPEARLTGWQSDIGATFCYSGKEMQPEGSSLTPHVAQVRDMLRSVTGESFDSVLINYYGDGKAGMRYHADPLYGKWTPHTAVVSLGDSRQFVFRRMDDHSVRWSYRVSNGDVVLMFGDCQDQLQHAVKVEVTAEAAQPRISLVYKQRLKLSDGSWA